jgi:hypothetical protein
MLYLLTKELLKWLIKFKILKVLTNKMDKPIVLEFGADW